MASMTARVHCGFVLLMMAGVASAHGQTPQPGFPGGGLWVHPSERTVPIELADGLVIAAGSLSGNGKASGPLAFVVDTAATATVVDSATAERLGWMTPGGTSTGATAKFAGRTLELAGASVGDRPVFGLPLDGLARQAGERVEGIAGSDIFQHFGVRIDYVHRGLTLVVPESCATPEKKLHVRMVGGLPFIEAKVGAPGGALLEGMFLVDTGQPGPGLILTAEFVAKHPELGIKEVRLPAFDSAGTVKSTAFLRLETLQLGEDAVRGVVASVAAPVGGDSGLAGVIGAGVLSRFDLLVDLPRHWLTLTPNADYAAPFEADMSGVLLLSGDAGGRSGEAVGRSGERGYTIAGIAEKSPASEAGLQQGDRLISVGERKVTEMSMDQIRGVLKSGPGTKVLVGVDRSGKKFSVTLTLRRAV